MDRAPSVVQQRLRRSQAHWLGVTSFGHPLWTGARARQEPTSRARRKGKGPETVGGGLRPSNSDRHIVTEQGYKGVTSRLRVR
jgi:hypothetical protein